MIKYNSQKTIPLGGAIAGAVYLRHSEERLNLFPRHRLEEFQLEEPPLACGGAPPLLRRRRAAEDGGDHVPRRSRRLAFLFAPANFFIFEIVSAEIGGGIVQFDNRQPQFEIRRHDSGGVGGGGGGF